MAWTTPLTAVSNAALTAAQWNASVRDNLNLTAPALATTATQMFVATGLNTIVARTPTTNVDVSAATTTSTSYAAPNVSGSAGPSVTVTTGVRALVSIQSVVQNGTGGAEVCVGYAVSGATTIAAADEQSIRFTPYTASVRGRHGIVDWPTLTAGSNVFTMQYKATSGTGVFDDRLIVVLPF